MKQWYEGLPGDPKPEPLRGKHLISWPKNQKVNQACNLNFCPVAYSELYMIAHHIPIVAIAHCEGPEIMLDLRYDRLISPPRSKSGEWHLNYIPLALRLLPFNATASGKQERIVDVWLTEDLPKSREDQAEMKSYLVRFAHGRKRLTNAAQALLDEGFLKRKPNSITYEINLDALPQANLKRAHAQAFRLLMVMIFSKKNYLSEQHFSSFQLFLENSKAPSKKEDSDTLSFLSSSKSIPF